MVKSSSTSGSGEARNVFADPTVQSHLIELTKSFIYAALDGDTGSCAELFAPRAVWLSPFLGENRSDDDGFRSLFDTINSRGYRIIMTQLSLDLLLQHAEGCCVIARAFLYVGAGGVHSPILSSPFRAVFHWDVLGDASARISCLDVTLPVERDNFGALGHGANVAEPRPESWENRLELRDTEGVTHFVDPSNIIYVEAQGRRTIIHSRDGNLSIQEGIGKLESLLGNQFVRLHRTYLVNGWMVKSLSAQGAALADGTVLPVPARRLVALRNEINAVRKPRRLSLSDLDAVVQAVIADGNDDGNNDRSGSD